MKRALLPEGGLPAGRDLQPTAKKHRPPISLTQMKRKQGKKRSLLLRPQKHMIGFADGFQSCFPLLIILQPLFDLRPDFGANAELFGHTTGIPDREYPSRMAAAGRTLRATFFVSDGALQ
jgi:hypothetical protein